MGCPAEADLDDCGNGLSDLEIAQIPTDYKLNIKPVLGYYCFWSDIIVAHQSPLRWDDLPFDPSPFIKDEARISPTYASSLGALYSDDCMAILPWIKDEVVDTVFADPPFNLGKEYGNRSNDSLSEKAYLDWCQLQEA